MKVAIVHDWLTNYGGAERVLKKISELFPAAPIYTIVYNKERMGGIFSDVRPSFIQHMPFGVQKYTAYLPFMPKAVERFDLSEYDLVISSSTCCAKGVLTRADTLHVCYCATPMRYAWDFYFDYLKSAGGFKRKLIPHFMHHIRMWDVLAANRVDQFLANSKNVQRRIAKHYRRDSRVVYPFADTEFFVPSNRADEGYYLVVSRLVEYKRVDLAVQAFHEMGRRLVVIGDGRELENLKKLQSPHVQFLGRCSNEKIREYYQNCRAFVFPGEEDFGITPVEAQACGRPVIAYGRGGALETVVDGETGVFFAEQSVASLIDAVRRFEGMDFQPEAARQNALRFSEEVFEKSFLAAVEAAQEAFH